MAMLEPYDEVMADRGSKIREELMMIMATLCIPPSKAASMQMLTSDVRKTSSIVCKCSNLCGTSYWSYDSISNS